MPESYRFTWQGGTGELIEKKSRFIATVSPVKSEEEAQRFIEPVSYTHLDVYKRQLQNPRDKILPQHFL